VVLELQILSYLYESLLRTTAGRVICLMGKAETPFNYTLPSLASDEVGCSCPSLASVSITFSQASSPSASTKVYFLTSALDQGVAFCSP